MNRGTNEITTPQTIALVGSTLVAVGIFTLPRTLAEKVGTPDMWISILMGGGITIFSAFIIITLSLRFPQKTFFQFNQIIIGKWLGTIISLIFIIYVITLASFEIRSMSELTKFHLLEDTPLSVLMISMMWVGTYLLVGGINPIVRLFEFLFPITILIFLTIILLGFKVFDLDNIRPVLGLGVIPALKGITPTLLTNSGVEFLLVWVAFMKTPAHAKRVIGWGIGIPIVLYLVTIIVVTGALSVDRIKVETWPTFTLVQQYEYTGIIFERFESMFLVVWLIQIFFTYIVCHYIAAIGLSHILNVDFKKITYSLLPVIYIISLIPKSLNQISDMGTMIGYVSFVFAMIIPAILLGISWMAGLKEGEKN
ncbi:GerAB/ArcD/ProY family transporter [Halobacillus sp. B23F22_1]|uniref:GerAB/ArcD/ProY family transporter n=1 Tax=Halobacillus sp. B23F22_1 TaxID=3459514 RepID=UPI00373EC40F